MNIMEERGEITLMLALVFGVLIPAAIFAQVVDVDGAAEKVVLYTAAMTAAGVIWRKFVRPVMKAVEIVLGLDRRVERIEGHLGLESETEA